MKMQITQEWLRRKAALEEGHEIGAGILHPEAPSDVTKCFLGCMHFQADAPGLPFCRHPDTINRTEIGDSLWRMRAEGGPCGPDAKLWEPES